LGQPDALSGGTRSSGRPAGRGSGAGGDGPRHAGQSLEDGERRLEDAGEILEDVGQSLEQAARRLGLPLPPTPLVLQALSHRSWCAENPGEPSNERLEFLGDAVLGAVVADHCYRSFPAKPEGELAKMRADVVNTSVLAEVAVEVGIPEVVRLGKGEDASGGRAKPSILADALEALIGAAYLELGFERVYATVVELLGSRIEAAARGPGAEDYKTRLQELAVRRFSEVPRYELRGQGPDHDRRYRARVILRGEVLGRGMGRSKKEAEQEAARAAWHSLGDSGGAPGA
jgi:ribonuclease-3